jgi:hypothetical protein
VEVFPYIDALLAAERLYRYAQNYAANAAMAKSKPYLTYATGIDHILGCDIIDALVERHYFSLTYRHPQHDTYYLNPTNTLPEDQITRRQILASVATAIEAHKSKLPRSHFRILYEASWVPGANST